VPEIAADPAFKRRLKRKPEALRRAIEECISRLAEDPRHPGLHTKRLQSVGGVVFSARIDRANRLTFHWDGSTIVLRNHCSHDQVLARP
jgi:mRNA-degrading endonuclease RelE of RelBE toxin-antitoxin system